jgi:hypothetical protein
VKNQNDLMFSLGAAFLAIVGVLVFWFTKREPMPAPPVEQVPLATPAFSEGSVVMADSLPGAENTGSGIGSSSIAPAGPPTQPSAVGVSGGGAPTGPPSRPSAAGVSGGGATSRAD